MTVQNPLMLIAAIGFAAATAWTGIERWRELEDIAFAPAEVFEVVARRDICGEYRAMRDTRHDCTRFIAHARFEVDGRFHVIAYPAGVVDVRNASNASARVRVGQRAPAAYRRSNPDDAWIGTTTETWHLPLWLAALTALSFAFALVPNRPPAALQPYFDWIDARVQAKREAELAQRAAAERARAAADQRRFEQG